MNENRKINIYDEGLRRAIAKRELQLPRMSDDLNQRLMQHMGQQKTIGKRHWLGAIAASVAIGVVLIGGWLAYSSKQDAKIVAEDGKKYETKAINKSMSEQQTVTLAISQAGKQDSSQAGKQDSSQEKQDSPQKKMGSSQEMLIRAEAKSLKAKEKSIVEERKSVSMSDSVELTDAQKVMTQYVAQVTKTCGATCLPLDCDRSEGKVFVFQDDEQTDVLGKLKNVLAWIDTENPAVRWFSTSNQMTLELDGGKDQKSVNEIWFADRQYGYVYLYYSRAKEDSWKSASCYTAFLDQNSRKLSNL